MSSAFGSWNGRDAFVLGTGVSLHSTGGEQVLLCRVEYEPGAGVRRHAHEASEQVMAIIEGDVTITVGDETKTLHAGDTVVMNRGVEHELATEGGCVFFEALAPVPLDHVEDPGRDLVLGPDGGRLHVER
jgi:quercetin dioxygenase-like cupin family protein